MNTYRTILRTATKKSSSLCSSSARRVGVVQVHQGQIKNCTVRYPSGSRTRVTASFGGETSYTSIDSGSGGTDSKDDRSSRDFGSEPRRRLHRTMSPSRRYGSAAASSAAASSSAAAVATATTWSSSVRHIPSNAIYDEDYDEWNLHYNHGNLAAVTRSDLYSYGYDDDIGGTGGTTHLSFISDISSNIDNNLETTNTSSTSSTTTYSFDDDTYSN